MMKVTLQAKLNDSHLDANQSQTQRQLQIAVASLPDDSKPRLPLNLCLVLDHSGSMQGKPITTVKEAAIAILNKLQPSDGISSTLSDRLSVVAFDHEAKVIVKNQEISNLSLIKDQINRLKADGGTSIDEGLKLGLQEIAEGKQNRVSQIWLLTDGENEHGNNNRCLQLAKLAAECNVTLHTLGFGSHWNQDVLEKIADEANGSLTYIETPEKAANAFTYLFSRIESVRLTNSYLFLELMPNVRLAELKPIAQVSPDTIELPLIKEGSKIAVRLGDLMTKEKIILANLYLDKLPPGKQTIAKIQLKYDDPALNATDLYSENIPIEIEVQPTYTPQVNPEVQKSILTLAKYRQTQLAEAKLQQGDNQGAATMLQTAAKTALQLGDETAATVLQTSATLLQSGEELSPADQKKTKIVSKTIIQS
jgi:Ca-activated chloride channel family protein